MTLMHIVNWRCRWEYYYCVSLILVGVVDGFIRTNNQYDTTTAQQHLGQPFIFKRRKLVGLFLSQQQPHITYCNENEVFWATEDKNRRRVLTATTTALTTVHSSPQIADSATQASGITTDTTINCLQDLPGYNPKTTVRLYLCRHGETEYNRNNIIQGARIDPPINDLGVEQAKRLGQALHQTIIVNTPHQLTSTAQSTILILHSELQRSKQTADLVAKQIPHPTTKSSNHLPSQQQQRHPFITATVRPLGSLAEVDFGSIAEGAPVQQYRQELLALYTAWAVGNYQARMPAGGESGIEILNRISQALYTMIDMAANETSSSALIAITHSSYLRILLGAVQDFAFFSATIPQSNCGINVIDFPRPSMRTLATTNRFGGEGDNNSSNNTILIPKGNVIRVNEKRHLSAIQPSEGQPRRNSITSSY